MNKNLLIVLLAVVFLIASVAFDIMQKRAFAKTQTEVKEQVAEIKSVAALQDLWKAKGIKSKIGRILNMLPQAKKANIKIARSKAAMKLVNLSDKELNRFLSKLAMLPIEFKTLSIKRANQNYSMECVCVW